MVIMMRACKKMIIVAFDISSPKKRRKVVDMLTKFGKRINRSVFECMVTDSQYQIVSTELHILCEKRDSIIIIPVCINCFSKMETILCGKKDKPETLLILD